MRTYLTCIVNVHFFVSWLTEKNFVLDCQQEPAKGSPILNELVPFEYSHVTDDLAGNGQGDGIFQKV